MRKGIQEKVREVGSLKKVNCIRLAMLVASNENPNYL
jgi:hypothetical protein